MHSRKNIATEKISRGPPDKSSCHLSELSAAIAMSIGARGGIENASESARTRREKDRGGREILRQRSPTELLAFCTATCAVCPREFIVLYLDLLLVPPRLRGDRRRGALDSRGGTGKKNCSIFMAR